VEKLLSWMAGWLRLAAGAVNRLKPLCQQSWSQAHCYTELAGSIPKSSPVLIAPTHGGWPG